MALFAPVPLIQSLRFQLMLRAQEIELTYWESVKISLGGNFLNFVFLIGSTAGDVFKAYCTTLHTERKTEAVTTILFDRGCRFIGPVSGGRFNEFYRFGRPDVEKAGRVCAGNVGYFPCRRVDDYGSQIERSGFAKAISPFTGNRIRQAYSRGRRNG